MSWSTCPTVKLLPCIKKSFCITQNIFFFLGNVPFEFLHHLLLSNPCWGIIKASCINFHSYRRDTMHANILVLKRWYCLRLMSLGVHYCISSTLKEMCNTYFTDLQSSNSSSQKLWTLPSLITLPLGKST